MFNLNSSLPQLTNVNFVGNETLVNGGGMFNQNSSAATLENTGFFGNRASFGGGLYNLGSSDAELVNVVFSGNLAFRSGGGSGGGMLNNSSSPVLTNVTIAGNVAAGSIQQGGGMLNGNASQPVLVNVILWGNVAASAKEMSNVGGSMPQISFSLVEGSGGSGIGWNTAFGADGGGNLDADPLFSDPDGADNTPGTLDDDLRLRSGSPAIDAGNNSAPGLAGITTDFAGGLRFMEDPLTFDTGQGLPPVVDMGAFEFRRALSARVPVQSLFALVLGVLALLLVAQRKLWAKG
ncbi:MAG: hypothetical protein N3C12_07820 [Candidatus Binatia bacterium]|nr:hypothetical protein [Candidatus Binatia bacterium]